MKQKQTKILMGMPVTVEIEDADVLGGIAIEKIFGYFRGIDDRFSTYKETSEISKINRGELALEDYSQDMKEILELSERTKKQTNGFFDIKSPRGVYDPSGMVKGWAIHKAARRLKAAGFENFYVEAGGDVQVYGHPGEDSRWSIGIRNPFNRGEIVKVVHLKDGGIATSGSYLRGQHIYNPWEPKKLITDIVSLTVIGQNIYEADRFATAAFAMGGKGIEFIERTPGLEGYMIDRNGIATQTSGLSQYL